MDRQADDAPAATPESLDPQEIRGLRNEAVEKLALFHPGRRADLPAFRRLT